MPVMMRYPALVEVVGSNGNYVLSDHNRSPLAEEYERIENTRRTARGKRRRYFIADKRTFTLSWNTLPETNVNTVDENAGASQLIQMYESETGVVTLRIYEQGTGVRTAQCHITGFSSELVYRYNDFYYDISVTFEEI